MYHITTAPLLRVCFFSAWCWLASVFRHLFSYFKATTWNLTDVTMESVDRLDGSEAAGLSCNSQSKVLRDAFTQTEGYRCPDSLIARVPG
jgi:hypothetical protein